MAVKYCTVVARGVAAPTAGGALILGLILGCILGCILGLILGFPNTVSPCCTAASAKGSKNSNRVAMPKLQQVWPWMGVGHVTTVDLQVEKPSRKSVVTTFPDKLPTPPGSLSWL